MTIEPCCEALLEANPYSQNKNEKRATLGKRLFALTKAHCALCPEYSKILSTFGWNSMEQDSGQIENLPFLPVSVFKEIDLMSVPQTDVFKTLTSSGTTGQRVSKIYVDRKTATLQQKALAKIVQSFIGKERSPMLIIDCPSVVKDRVMFSARGAGILGFSIFGRDRTYALRNDMTLDVEAVQDFLLRHKGENLFLFGFTFMVWLHFCIELERLKNTGQTFDFSSATLIHGGGWKKLSSEAVSKDEFKARLKDVCGITHVYNYYGMVEQTGSIYMECECGNFHASSLSDVIIRQPSDFSVCPVGKKGLIQTLSAIPESYPGHSLLTEDAGILLGEDDCPCGRKGKYFCVTGRVKSAELRGCSDTYAAGLESTSLDCLKADFIIGNEEILNNMQAAKAEEPFSDERIEFLDSVSKCIMANTAARSFSDVITFAFWIRKANMQAQKKCFVQNTHIKLGRGVVFHIAPSNVPVNFAYSFVTGFVSGNANVVRLPSKDWPQVNLLLDTFREVLTREQFLHLRDDIVFLRYDKNSCMTDRLSAMCDVRVIWGGDATIADVRKSPLAPRATEIPFADRYSICVIDTEEYIAKDGKERQKIAEGFYNDTYLTDQNACSSPRLVCWLGAEETANKAKTLFWCALHRVAAQKYSIQAAQAVNKRSVVCLVAANIKGLKFVPMQDNLIVRVSMDKIDACVRDYRGNSGLFYEYSTDDILDIAPLCDRKMQTVSYIGKRAAKAIIERLIKAGTKGIDRVVPVGQTMDFGFVWDGINLIESMTRECYMRTGNSSFRRASGINR